MNKYGLLVLLISFVIVLTVILLITDHDNNLIIKVGAALISAVVVQQVVEKVSKNGKHADEQKQKLPTPAQSTQSTQMPLPNAPPYEPDESVTPHPELFTFGGPGTQTYQEQQLHPYNPQQRPYIAPMAPPVAL
jgi:hypothetical protein